MKKKILNIYGVTYGKVVTRKDDGKAFLIKKSARDQVIENKEVAEHRLSRNTVLSDQYKESFEEVCAARLFSYLKNQENYLPDILLCESSYTPSSNKPYNNPKIKDGLKKIYVASEIIGNKSQVNEDRKVINKEILNNLSPEIKKQAIDDICENAVIMMIILNYDLKLDNFVNIENKFVPIDFGNARYEDQTNPDIISAIDEIRNTSSKRNDSNRFSSKNLKNRFSDTQSESTRKFYRENLKPIHFLNVIARIENDRELENKLRDITNIYSFGNEENKKEHADVIVARTNNLRSLKQTFERLHQKEVELENQELEESNLKSSSKTQNQKRGSFFDCNLRMTVSRDKVFRNSLESEIESSKAKQFNHFVNV